MGAGQPALLIVGGGINGAGLDCVTFAKEYGFRVIVTETAERLAAAPQVVARADLAVELDRTDIDGHVAWAKAYSARENLAGVYCFREWAVPTTAAVAEALGLPGSPFAAASLVRDKFRCRERLRERGFAQPRAALCAGVDDATAFVSRVPGPWVVKPTNTHGSLGVTVVRRVDDVAAAVAVLPPAHRQHFIVEEFQPGTEYSADGLFVDGRPHVLALFVKTPLRDSILVEQITAPAPLPPDLAEQATRVVRDGLGAAGLTFGAFHVEFWIHDGRVVLGELHNRPAGSARDMFVKLVETVSGVNVHRAVFEQLLGRRPDLTGPAAAAAGTYMDVYAAPGVVQPGLSAEAVADDPACLSLYVSVRPGDHVRELRQEGDMPAMLTAAGSSGPDSRRHAMRLADLLALSTAPD
ncbi:ATP-grasp domain-containing protein [Actinoplanes sp. NPDC049265]|uniref:ATP-grasp domain-containing protein n=1 Tax=Actinoplanes sp. NPDC049265 TaxID=3363902 RepID=UPI003716CED6